MTTPSWFLTTLQQIIRCILVIILIIILLLLPLLSLQGNLRSQSKYWLLFGLIIEVFISLDFTRVHNPSFFSKPWPIIVLYSTFSYFPIFFACSGILLRLYHLLFDADVVEESVDRAKKDLKKVDCQQGLLKAQIDTAMEEL